MSPGEVVIAQYSAFVGDIARKQAFALARDDLQEYGDLEWARAIVLVARDGERLDPDKPGGAECPCIECHRWANSGHQE